LQWLSGSCPAGTSVQVPAEPTRLHASQAPVQALLQQTLPVQKPERQSVEAAQASPFSFFAAVQRPDRQLDPATQSALFRHFFRQAPPSQTYGAHEVGAAAGRQTPLPSHVRAGV
jgi:hypothetical protein